MKISLIQPAKELAKKIRLDEQFYLYLSNKARNLYSENYTEAKFKEKFIL